MPGTPMLTRIHIENYKCLRDVTVDLAPFTVLIGPNDSGKSSLLDALRQLGNTTNLQVHQVFGGDKALANLVWRRDSARTVVWEVSGSLPELEFVYSLRLAVDGTHPIETLTAGETPILPDNRGTLNSPPMMTILALVASGHVRTPDDTIYRQVGAALNSSIEFRFDPSKMTVPSAPQANATLSSSGDNLAAFLDGLLTGPNRSAFSALERDLNRAIPTICGIALPAKSSLPGAKSIEYVLASDGPEPVTIPASLASSGALILTAYLALAYSKTPDLLFIEEPENGLHPSRLQMVVDVLRKMTTGEIGGRKRQVVITTHSPLLLNYVKPEEVRVFVQDPGSGTSVKAMKDIPDIDRLMKEFALGELWYLLGEEKLFTESPA
jgi:predicted ATPase